MFKIGYWTFRDWDCYWDKPGDFLHKRIGICYRNIFFGVEWTIHCPEN